MMQLYPTIHIKNGRCFNPSAAPLKRQNIYTSNPAVLARIYEDAGASWRHIVDVDGASMGMPVNSEIVKSITGSVHIPVQVGGGVRSVKDIDYYLNMGVTRVVCSTRPAQNRNFNTEVISLFGSEHYVVGIDAINGMVAIDGRERFSKFNAISLINVLSELGVENVVYTDVIRSSLHSGPSIENTRELVMKSNMNIITAGGISSLSHLDQIEKLGVSGAIIATALYDGSIDLREAINRFEKGRRRDDQ